MKSVLNLSVIHTLEDVNIIRQAVSSNEGVIACEINREKSEVSVVYYGQFLSINDIIDSIEELGYTVL